METDIVERLEKATREMQKANINGWPNVCMFAGEEITRLRAELATARNYGLEAAAKVCDEQAAKFLRLALDPKCTGDIRWDNPHVAVETMRSYAERHAADAAAVRDLKRETV